MGINDLKQLLKEEIDSDVDDNPMGYVKIIPVLHNDNLVILLFYGWAINLYPDGTYEIESTEGG